MSVVWTEQDAGAERQMVDGEDTRSAGTTPTNEQYPTRCPAIVAHATEAAATCSLPLKPVTFTLCGRTSASHNGPLMLLKEKSGVNECIARLLDMTKCCWKENNEKI